MNRELEPIVLEAPPGSRQRPQGGSGSGPGRRRYRAGWAAALTIVVVAAGRLTGAGPAGGLAPDEAGQPVTAASGEGSSRGELYLPPAPATPELPPGWRWMARSPLPARSVAASVWTGTEVVVWGGYGTSILDDGAAYDPRSDRWRSIAPAPIAGRVQPVAVWTGNEVIIWGGFSDDPAAEGAAYDPRHDRWRRLAPAPAPLSPSGGVWTGKEMILWGDLPVGRPSRGGLAAGAAYDPAADRWRLLPRAPIERRHGHGTVWTGREMIVWGGGSDHGEVAWTLADGAAYDPAANRWRRLSPAPLAARAYPATVWSGSEVLVVGGVGDRGPAPDGAAYDPVADRWRALAPAPEPVDDYFGSPSATWTGRQLVLAQGAISLLVYDPAVDAWHEPPGAGLPNDAALAAWTGEELLLWGGNYGASPVDEGVAWRPGGRAQR